jgi:hypothetical protein
MNELLIFALHFARMWHGLGLREIWQAEGGAPGNVPVVDGHFADSTAHRCTLDTGSG